MDGFLEPCFSVTVHNTAPFKLHRFAAEFGYVMLPSFVDERRHFLCDNKIKLITRRLHRLLVDKRHANCYRRYSSTYILIITRTRSYRNSLILALSRTYWSWLHDIICSVALALRVDIVSPAATMRLQMNLYFLCLCLCPLCSWLLEIICSVAMALRVDIESSAATRRLKHFAVSVPLSLCAAGCWTLFALSHWLLGLILRARRRSRRLPQTFILEWT